MSPSANTAIHAFKIHLQPKFFSPGSYCMPGTSPVRFYTHSPVCVLCHSSNTPHHISVFPSNVSLLICRVETQVFTRAFMATQCPKLLTHISCHSILLFPFSSHRCIDIMTLLIQGYRMKPSEKKYSDMANVTVLCSHA